MAVKVSNNGLLHDCSSPWDETEEFGISPLGVDCVAAWGCRGAERLVERWD